jgi:hypothetical protein
VIDLHALLSASVHIERERERFRYGCWTIYFDPPPIPDRSHDWHFYHDDYDGAEDAHDDRCGDGPSVEDCKRQIDELDAEHAERNSA